MMMTTTTWKRYHDAYVYTPAYVHRGLVFYLRLHVGVGALVRTLDHMYILSCIFTIHYYAARRTTPMRELAPDTGYAIEYS